MTTCNDLSDLRIIIVEDQSEARSIMKTMLSQMGITQVFEASDGKDALGFLDMATDMIDLVICDWNMPKMTGMDLLRQLRTVDPNLPFLMVTGRSDIESVMEAKACGVTGYVSKPFSASQLEAKLRIILNRLRKAG